MLNKRNIFVQVSSYLYLIYLMSNFKNYNVLFYCAILICLLGCRNHLSKQIPELPELSSSSNALQTQIINAHQKAIGKSSAVNLGELGMVYYSSNYYSRAKTCFELAKIKDSDAWEWRYYKGLIHMELGESDSALFEMKSIKKSSPNVWLASYRLSDIYRQMDSLGRAEEILKEIINLNEGATKVTNSLRSTYFPLQLHAKLLLSKVYNSGNKNSKAKAELKYLTNRYKTFGPPFRELGILYDNEGNPELSNKYRERAADLEEVNEPLDTLQDNLALMSASESYVLKQIDIARQGVDSKWSYELIKSARENMPESKYVLSKAISQYLAQGTGELAMPLLNKHFDSFKDDYNEMIKIGVELADAGYRTEALRYLKHARSFENITDTQLTNISGMYLEKLNIPREAVKIMETVVDRNTNNAEILGDAIFLMLQANELETAEMYYIRLKKIDSQNPSINIYEGMQMEKKGNIEEAIRCYLAAFVKNPKNKFIIGHIKDLMLQQKRWREMESFLRKALEAYPNDSQVQMYLGWVLVSYPDDGIKTNDITEGLEYSERAFFNCRYQIADRVSAGRTLAVGYHLLNNNTMANYYLDRTIGIAAKARFGQDYIGGLQNLKRRFANKAFN